MKNIDKERKIWLTIKPHHHTVLAHIRSNQYVQLYDREENIPDTEEVKKCRGELEKDYSIINICNLVRELNKQLRYKESVFYLEEAIKKYPDNFDLKRLLAIRYLTTNRVDDAIDLFLNLLEETNDELDIKYRLGLGYFYNSQYFEAKKYFMEALSLTKNNKEMHIACIYWLLLTAINLKENIDDILKLYISYFVIHHAGYEYAIRLFLNEDEKDFEDISNSDNLTRIMYLFGLYHYYLYIGENKKAERIFSLGLNCDEYWSSFSGLGFWYLNLRQSSSC